MPSGHKSFYFCYRAGKGRGAPKRQVQLGAFPDLTVEQAREKAKRFQAQVVQGQDPAKDIQQAKERKMAAALRLVALTGARVSESLSLKWEYLVDLDAGLVHLPDSKTGFKVLHLSTPAIEVLQAVPVHGEFVFPSTEAACGHITSLRKVWGLVRTRAELKGRWRIHDLRHAYASAAINSGASFSFVGKLLGHSQASTTARYAHVAENPAHKVAEETGARIAEAFKAKPKSEVIPFRPRKAGGE